MLENNDMPHHGVCGLLHKSMLALSHVMLMINMSLQNSLPPMLCASILHGDSGGNKTRRTKVGGIRHHEVHHKPRCNMCCIVMQAGWMCIPNRKTGRPWGLAIAWRICAKFRQALPCINRKFIVASFFIEHCSLCAVCSGACSGSFERHSSK